MQILDICLNDFGSDYVNPIPVKLVKVKEKGLLWDNYNVDFSKYGQDSLNHDFLDSFTASMFLS